jgi:hypothetical protein
MNIFSKVAAAVLGGAAAIVALVFGLNLLALGVHKTFGPAHEAIRYETFQYSQAHIDGVVRQVRDYRTRYATAETDEAKGAIRTAVFSELGSMPIDVLPPDVAGFVRELGR